jgi:hypothetical protein
MPTVVPPWLEMVTDRRADHAVLFGKHGELDQFTRCELLRGRFVTKF